MRRSPKASSFRCEDGFGIGEAGDRAVSMTKALVVLLV
jgi:hypothetical protein